MEKEHALHFEKERQAAGNDDLTDVEDFALIAGLSHYPRNQRFGKELAADKSTYDRTRHIEGRSACTDNSGEHYAPTWLDGVLLAGRIHAYAELGWP